MQHKYHEDDRNFLKRIYGDSHRYLQILLNFMSNAVKFTPEKGRITIQTILKDKQLVQQRMTMSEDEGAGNAVVPGGHRTYQKNHTNSLRESSFSNDKNSLHVQMRQYYIEFEIHIIDTGCGISKENIPKLFMNFSRLEEH